METEKIFVKEDGDGEYAEAEVLLNLLLNYTEELELKQRPCGIRNNFSCTFNSTIVSLDLAHSDDNGAYLQKRYLKRLYYVGDSSCVTTHCQNGTYYINKRSGAKYQKIYVDCNEVYELNNLLFPVSNQKLSFFEIVKSLMRQSS